MAWIYSGIVYGAAAPVVAVPPYRNHVPTYVRRRQRAVGMYL